MASYVKDKITSHMTAILKALDCAICLSIVKSPVSMGCGHFFCRLCIVEVLKSNYRTPCPLCKRSFTRRSIENADQRNSIVLAAGKLALECGKFTGANIVSPDTLNLFNNLEVLTCCSSTTSLNETKEEPKPSRSRKRKSQENDVCEKISGSRSCDSNTDSKILVPDTFPANGEVLQGSNKRQRQFDSQSSQSDEEFELPSLDEIIASVKISNTDNQQENNDELYVQEKKGSNRKSLKVSFADTPAVSCKTVSSSNRRVSVSAKESNNEEPEENENNKEKSQKLKTSKLTETIQNKKNALKNKTNQIISNGNENIVKKTPVNKKISNDSAKSPDDKAKENIIKKVTRNEDSNVTSLVAMSPKSSAKGRPKMKPGKSRSNKAETEEEAIISKLKAAENFTLTVVNTRQKSNSSITVPEECYSLYETNLLNLSENLGDCPMDAVQLCQKEEKSRITDTAVSVQSVVSPTANKLETLSKSPGWSKVRQVGKDFRVKKFSKLQVEKNSSNSCPMEFDVSENSSGGSSCEMPKLIKISELEREVADNNSKNAECVMNNKSDSKQNSQKKNKKYPAEQGSNSIKVTAEIHSQELYNLNSKENESSNKNEGNENLSNYDESETSIVMNTMEKTQSSDKSIFSNQNTSNTTKKVSDASIVNFYGSCIPSPDMLSVKPNIPKVSDLANDIRNSSAEMEFQNDDEFPENMQTALLDTYDSHVVENDMEIEENDQPILPVHDNRVEPCMEIIGKVSGLEMYNKQKFQKLPLNVSSKETESTKLSPKFRSVSKSVTTGTKTLFSGDETIYFASHSQQTSQRLLEFSGDNTPRHNGALVPAFGLYRHTIPGFDNGRAQNQSTMFNKPSSAEKTKVLKRTCLTLEEIQDAFTKCSNERPVTICSLPFSSGEYRLDINVADETLNISVLKIDSFERPNETVERTSTIMFSEKNVQTSDSLPSPIAVLPSSNAESECSLLDNNVKEPPKNLFPYLNQYFSDSDPSQQCNMLPDDNEDPLEVSGVLPFKPDNHCDPQQELEETTRVVESMKTLLSELQALPSKAYSLSDVRIVTESVSVYDEEEDDVEPSRHSKELAEGLPTTKDCGSSDLQRITDNQIVSETGGNIVRETVKQSNELVISRVTKKADESIQYDDLPPTQEAFGNRDKLSAHKNKCNSSSKDFCSQKESTNSFEKEKGVSPKSNSLNLKKLKGTEYENQPESGKKNSSSLSQKLRTISSNFNSVNKSHLTLMEKYSTEETDPDLAAVEELVGPLKELAKELKASGKASEGTSLMGGERAANQKRPLDVFEEIVFSKNHDSSGVCLPSQRASRLSLKSKGTPKKFKRIQRYSCSEDSDSEKEDITQKIPSPKHSVLTPSSKENASGSSIDCTTHSFVSEDLTNGNTSDIAMEIESLDEKIKSVMTKLKDIGREDLLDSENGPGVSKLGDDLSLSDDNEAASDDSQKSTDIFSVPPTPPDALASDIKTLKTSRWKN